MVQMERVGFSDAELLIASACACLHTADSALPRVGRFPVAIGRSHRHVIARLGKLLGPIETMEAARRPGTPRDAIVRDAQTLGIDVPACQVSAGWRLADVRA